MIDLKSYALKSDQGPHLNLNEDLVEADVVNKLFLVVDGFGGSNVGDRAASLIGESIKKFFTKIALDPEGTLPFFYNHKYLLEGNALINALHTAHKNVTQDNQQKSMNHRGGGSVVAAALAENVLTLVSTGNCVAYLLREGEVSMQVLPDSLANLSRTRSYGHYSVPMSGVGLFEDLSYSVRELKIAKGDVIVMLTDGVHARLKEADVKEAIEKNIEDELKAIEFLFQTANERGNIDNQSAIILQF